VSGFEGNVGAKLTAVIEGSVSPAPNSAKTKYESDARSRALVQM